MTRKRDDENQPPALRATLPPLDFRLLVESVKDYAIFMLDVNGNVSSWNAGAERIKGYRADEIVGKHFSIFYPREDIEAGRPERELAIAGTDGRYEEEGWRLRKDGSRFWANVVVTAIHDEKGALVGFAKVTRDLTERRKAEDERLRLAQAQEAIRLRDEFLSIASHELKTPLTALQLQLDAMRESSADGRTEKRLDRAIRNAGRLAALIETLLDVARITNGKLKLNPERFELGAAAREVVDRLSEDASRAACEVTVRTGEPVEGEWDRLRVEQVLVNILSNAIKYGAGKPITVEVGGDGAEARVAITDGGHGISEEDIARIFDRFERAVSIRHYGGLGLGLYIARQIAEAHGGIIRVASRPGEGATFTICLPIAAAARAGASPEEATSEGE